MTLQTLRLKRDPKLCQNLKVSGPLSTVRVLIPLQVASATLYRDLTKMLAGDAEVEDAAVIVVVVEDVVDAGKVKKNTQSGVEKTTS